MIKPTKYRLIRGDRASQNVKAGDIVYGCIYHDYGSANADTRDTGIDHISVSLKEDGGYPYFTIPRADLKEESTT